MNALVIFDSNLILDDGGVFGPGSSLFYVEVMVRLLTDLVCEEDEVFGHSVVLSISQRLLGDTVIPRPQIRGIMQIIDDRAIRDSLTNHILIMLIQVALILRWKLLFLVFIHRS